MSNIVKLPTLQDLVKDDDMTLKQNALMVICNQTPPKDWLSKHPTVKIKSTDSNGNEIMIPMPYLPIGRVEYLLSRVFGKWWVEVKDSKIMANSVVVTVRLYVTNPLTGEVEWNDGIGANPIQTNAGAGAMDWNAAKNNGVQLAAPAAEAYAFKDAAEKFGKLFGKDLTRKDAIGYDSLLKTDKPTFESLSDMYAEKVELMSKEDVAFAERVLNKDKPEVNSFKKLNEILIKL
jgi:hypothetical protein